MSHTATEPIPQDWIKKQIDGLTEIAKQMSPGPMQDAVLFRAHTYLDLVEAWRKNA